MGAACAATNRSTRAVRATIPRRGRGGCSFDSTTSNGGARPTIRFSPDFRAIREKVLPGSTRYQWRCRRATQSSSAGHSGPTAPSRCRSTMVLRTFRGVELVQRLDGEPAGAAGCGSSRHARGGTRRRRPATAPGTARAAAAATAPARDPPPRGRRSWRGRCWSGTPAARPAGAAAPPRAPSGPGRTTRSPRTRSPRGRSCRRAAGHPRRRPRAAGRTDRTAAGSGGRSSCAGVTSTPTGRAPRRASRADR